MKLLVIDDNRALIRSLKDFLSKDFVIDSAHTYAEGLRLVADTSHDIIVLDLSLPDGNGDDLCRQVRKTDSTTPIIILTAVNNVQSRVDLLNSGADDYLMKPFSLAELRARLFALLRRMPGTPGATQLSADDLLVHVGIRKVIRAGQEIILRRKEFDILEYLLRNKGQAVSRAMIFDNVWESDKDRCHNTVDVHIKHLRDKIDRPFGHPLIKTAYGIGYVIDDTSST